MTSRRKLKQLLVTVNERAVELKSDPGPRETSLLNDKNPRKIFLAR